MQSVINSSSVRGVFIGLTTLDYVYYTDIYPENNNKIKTESYTRYVGGPAANAAITYSLLGGCATLITCLGSGPEASLITDILNSYGVTVINTASDNCLPNISTIVVDRMGHRTVFSGQKHYSSLSFPEIPESAFCLFDLNQQELSLPFLEKVSSSVILDAGNWKPNSERFLKRADIIISSETFHNPDDQNIFEMPAASGKLTAVTRGEKSILTPQGDIPVPSAECIDSLAAGDIFHGAFCYAFYGLNLSFEASLESAAKIASESVKYPGPREWVHRYYSQLGDNEHKPEACFKACVHYHPTMEAGQNT